MKHKDCGGEITEDETHPGYTHVDEDGNDQWFPAIFCLKCGKEIVGDAEIELEDRGRREVR